jgi:hypothetical protein
MSGQPRHNSQMTEEGLQYGKIYFSKFDLVLWDAIADAKVFGSRQWWFPRYQGRFFTIYLHSN